MRQSSQILEKILIVPRIDLKDADAWLDKILSNLTQSTREYAHNNAMSLALGGVIHEMQQDKDKNNKK